MSCCGQARDRTDVQQNVNQPVTPFHINQQPAGSPGPGWPNQEKPYQPQGIPSPPPAAQPPLQPQMTGFSMNSTGMYQPQQQSAPSAPGSPFQQNQYGHPNGSISNGYNQFAQPPPLPPASPPVIHPHTPVPPSQFGSMSNLQRPTPVLANGYQSEPYRPQPHAVSKSPQPQSTVTSQNRNSAQNANQNDGKLVVSIDFGTTMSGVAYGSTRLSGGKVQQVLNWPGTQDTYRKIPTCLLYDEHGRVLSWGVEAKSSGPIPGTYKCEWVSLLEKISYCFYS